MIRHITYTDANMTIAAQLCSDSARRYGCDVSTIYTAEDLPAWFRSANRDILKHERGAGYWLWKPQIILQEMDKAAPDDIIVYTDAGVEFIKSVTYLVKEMDGFCMLFHNQWFHHEWCKGDVLKIAKDYKPSHQIQASAMLWKNNSMSDYMLNMWLKVCQEEGMIDDSPSIEPNHPDFREHRHDQAILTSLTLGKVKYNWWPASYSNGLFTYPKSGDMNFYPVIFNHHRKRNAEFQA